MQQAARLSWSVLPRPYHIYCLFSKLVSCIWAYPFKWHSLYKVCANNLPSYLSSIVTSCVALLQAIPLCICGKASWTGILSWTDINSQLLNPASGTLCILMFTSYLLKLYCTLTWKMPSLFIILGVSHCSASVRTAEPHEGGIIKLITGVFYCKSEVQLLASSRIQFTCVQPWRSFWASRSFCLSLEIFYYSYNLGGLITADCNSEKTYKGELYAPHRHLEKRTGYGEAEK